jgi:hypothetical protein
MFEGGFADEDTFRRECSARSIQALHRRVCGEGACGELACNETSRGSFPGHERARFGLASARAVFALVRPPRLDCARTPARASGEGARRPFRAADRAHRSGQDAGGLLAQPGGAQRGIVGRAGFISPHALHSCAGAKQAGRARRWRATGRPGAAELAPGRLHRTRYPARRRAAHPLHLSAEGARR